MKNLPPHVYSELKRLAAVALRKERPDHTLQVTALAHEAYLRLSDQLSIDYDNSAGFRANAARSIRRILVDHAKARLRQKRGGGVQSVTLTIADPAVEDRGFAVLEISELLDQLAKVDSRQASVVEFRFFGGLSIEETAQVLEVSTRTINNEWRMARAWLLDRLKAEPDA